ncbi:hypothetical protein EDC04DRAFT_2696397, partial [Pisolithus marmoratus]
IYLLQCSLVFIRPLWFGNSCDRCTAAVFMIAGLKAPLPILPARFCSRRNVIRVPFSFVIRRHILVYDFDVTLADDTC